MRLVHPSQHRDTSFEDSDSLTPGDLESLYVDVVRSRTADVESGPRLPWLLLNMVTSLDGATAVDGLSAGLGSVADRAAFSIIRSIPDVILVASGTVISEDYRPVMATPERARARAARGQSEAARLAIVTGSLSIDVTSPLFRDSTEPPIVITAEAAPTARLVAARRATDVVVAGEDRVDVTEACRQLGAIGAEIVLSEGGPTLNGQLVAAGLIDELCLTLSPTLVGGPSPRLAHGDHSPTHAMDLAHIVHDEDTLLVRYTRG